MEFVLSENKSGVLWVTINRPEIHNAFNEKFIAELTSTFEAAALDEKVRLIVLTGAGKSFCAGADLNWMKSMVNYSMEENIADSKKLAHLFYVINTCIKPVIGKINGHALGGGVGLVSACDYAITTTRAKFGFTETRLGLIPAVISPYVINKIGESHARAWFLSGERFDAHKALMLGFVHEVVELDDLDEACTKVIESFLTAGPMAAEKAKELIVNILERTHSGKNLKEIEEYTCHEIAKRRVSAEGQEGMSALLEKRKAKWVLND
jgi:methylglutaconyl-CoA hydratase